MSEQLDRWKKAISDSQIQAGDLVMIHHQPTPEEASADSFDIWIYEMNRYIGQIRVVKSVTQDGFRFDKIVWNFPPSSLVKMKPLDDSSDTQTFEDLLQV